MPLITHTLTGWKVFEPRTRFDEKGQEVKFEAPVSPLRFCSVDEAVAYFAAVHPGVVIELKCEACGSGQGVEPETVGDSYLLTCKRCRACPSTYSPPSEAELGKPCKKPRVIHEVSREEFLALTRKELRQFGLKLTGCDSVDRKLRLPHAPKKPRPVEKVIAKSDAPEECQVCGEPVGDSFVDGVVRGAGWAYLCPKCHKRCGIGLGPGKGQLYVLDGDRYHTPCETSTSDSCTPSPAGSSSSSGTSTTMPSASP
jgi:hypothetical protein